MNILSNARIKLRKFLALCDRLIVAYAQIAVVYKYTENLGGERRKVTFRLRDVVKQLGIAYVPRRDYDADTACKIPFYLSVETGFVLRPSNLPKDVEATHIYLDFSDYTCHVRYRKVKQDA